MTQLVEYDLRVLLEYLGSIPPRYGHVKWTCPLCGSRGCLSVDLDRGLFHCFHAGCNFSGNVQQLAHSLGLACWLSRKEYLQLRHQRERADRTACQLYALWKSRWSELVDFYHLLNGLEDIARQVGTDTPLTWTAFEIIYPARQQIVAELSVLENTAPADLIKFFACDEPSRRHILDRVIVMGGLYDARGKFVELNV